MLGDGTASLGAVLTRAQRRMELPRARATASENVLRSRGSSDIGLIGARWWAGFHRVSACLARGSQPEAQAGRNALEGRGKET
jgi:hypothetical protein